MKHIRFQDINDARKRTKIIFSIVLNLFAVSFLTSIAALLGSTLDGLIVSHFLGEEVMGAYGLASPLFNLIEMASAMFAAGTVVVCGNLIGNGKAEEAGKTFSSGFTMCLLVGGLLALLLFFCPQAGDFLIVKENTDVFLPGLHQYIRGLSLSIPANMLCSLLISIVQLDGGKRRAVVSAVVLCCMNLGGNMIVVTFTALGLLGIGLMTTLSYYCSFAVLLHYLLKKQTVFRPGFSFQGLKALLRGGVPALFSRAATMLRNLFYNIFAVQTGGPAGIVAWSTVNSLSAFLSGFSKASGHETLVGSGVFLGEHDKETVCNFMRCSFIVGMMITIPVIIAVILLAPFLAGIYISDNSASYSEAVFGLRWYALGLLPLTLNLILSNYYQSAGKTRMANIIYFCDGFGALVLFSLFFLQIIGFDGLWYTFFIGKMAVLLGTLLYICIRNRKLRISMENLLLLPPDFDVADEDKFYETVSDTAGAVNISNRIIEFCKTRGADDRCSMYVGLAIEEMTQIIMEEGFVDGKEHTIDIRVFLKDGKIIIRLRDDCKMFDTNKRIAIMNPEDSFSHPGIRILNHISQNTDYYGVLNVNYLNIYIVTVQPFSAE